MGINIHYIDEEEMFVGRDINISSESFISEEQLFSLTEDTDKKSARDTSKASLSSPSKLVLTTPTTTIALSNGDSGWKK